MKQQIFVIHGGDAFNSYSVYLKNLRKAKIDFKKITPGSKGWKAGLPEKLGPTFEVILPRMPNGQNAKYLEWKIWFKKFIPYLTDNVIFVGHSLGGIFLSKYLSEEKFPKKIAATFLIAAPFNSKKHHPLADFNLTGSLKNLESQAGDLFLYHSKDDKVVPISNLYRYQKALPNAQLKIFTNKGHFNQEHFPELVRELKKHHSQLGH